MISSFFDKTKPINYLVLLGFVMLLYWGLTLRFYGNVQEIGHWGLKILASLALVFSAFLLGNMAKAKKLTLDNSFTMLFFCLLLMSFFGAIADFKMVFCYFFILIAWNRALSLKSEKNQGERVFEAALWVLMASLFVDWAILFIIPVYMAIGMFCGKQIRFWLMPLAAVVCLFLLSFAYARWFADTAFFGQHYQFGLSLTFFTDPNYGLIFYLVGVYGVTFLVFGKLGYRRLGRTLSLRITFVFLVVATLLTMFTNQYLNGIEILTFVPAAVFLANYMETVKKQRIKETLVIGCIVVPVLVLLVRVMP